MKCPACQQEMAEQDFGGVNIDVCMKGCKSLWFDWTELGRLDERHEGLGQALNAALNSARHKDDHRGRLVCPKCGVLMVAHFYTDSKVVTVDECYACGGFFLDSGEMDSIRDNYMGESERKDYANKLLAQMPEYASAVARQNELKNKINPGAEARMRAVSKFSDMLGTYFGK